MPKTERGKAFEKLEPTLTHAEALAAFSAGAAAISLAGRPCLGDNGRIKYIAVKLALSDGRLPVVLFDRMSTAEQNQASVAE